MDCSPPDSSVHGILQARILDWVPMPFSRGSSRPSDQTLVSHAAGRFFTASATRKAQVPQGKEANPPPPPTQEMQLTHQSTGPRKSKLARSQARAAGRSHEARPVGAGGRGGAQFPSPSMLPFVILRPLEGTGVVWLGISPQVPTLEPLARFALGNTSLKPSLDSI